MLNPDGVIMGNYRSSLQGQDYNREFKLTAQYPVLDALVALARQLKQTHDLCMYLDLHGHSAKRNAFAYGPHFS